MSKPANSFFEEIRRKYGLDVKALRRIGRERFMAMSEDARQIFANIHKASKEHRLEERA